MTIRDNIKVLYDLIYLEKEKHGGISRMWMEYFKKSCDSQVKVVYMGSFQAENIAISFLKKNKFCGSKIISKTPVSKGLLARMLSLNIVNSFLLLWKLPKDVSTFHSTGYSNPLFKRKGLTIVTTIHDMVFWDQKHMMKKSISYWDNVWGIYHSLRVSDKIVTVSHASKESISKHFPWARGKIDVIYHGISEDFFKVDIDLKKEKYFMFIGGRNEYKNYDLLLRAFAIFVKTNPDWRLCVVGQNNLTAVIEARRYQELGIIDKVDDYGLVEQNTIICLIQKTSAVVIPSLNEGFNFPLLEAMACGSPVLSSDIPVSREIGQDYADYFENNEKDLLRCMIDIKKNGVDIERLLEARNYAQTFSWDNSYKELLTVYNSFN